MYCIQNKGRHCSPQEGVEGDTPLPGYFRVIVCPSPPQMNDFCELLGTPDAPVSKIESEKIPLHLFLSNYLLHRRDLYGPTIG